MLYVTVVVYDNSVSHHYIVCHTQVAKQFITAADGSVHPCLDYPNCPHCPMQLSGTVFNAATSVPCSACRAIRMTLYDVESDKLGTLLMYIYYL